MRLESCGQNAPSLSRWMSRFSRIPQVCGSLEAKRRLRKGIAILTTKPSGVSFRLGVEDGVKREIELLAFGPESVGLDSQGIGEKSIGPAMIVERVQHQLDVVIVKTSSRRERRARTFCGSLSKQTKMTYRFLSS